MRKVLYTLMAMAVAVVAVADPARADHAVDLRDAQAFEQLRQTNPAHFDTIRKILEGLAQQPERVESDWLQMTFDARDVELSRLLMKTSYPPKQVLQFRLDDTRYTLHVTRSDLVAQPVPAG